MNEEKIQKLNQEIAETNNEIRNLELEILAKKELINQLVKNNQTREALILTYKTLNQVNNN